MLEENKNIYLKWLKNPVKIGKMPGTDPKPGWTLLCASWNLLFPGPDLSAEGHGEVLSPALSKAGCKTPPGELPAAFPGTPAFGSSSAYGNELGKAGKQSSKNYSWLCHLGF